MQRFRKILRDRNSPKVHPRRSRIRASCGNKSISTYKCRVARTCVQESCRTAIVFGDRPFLRLFGKLLSSDAVDQHASYFVNGVWSRLPVHAERVSTRAFRFHVRLEHTTSVVRRQRSSQRISQIGHLTRESPIVQRLFVLL